MNAVWKKAALAASSVVAVLALAACGDRIENTDMPQTAQATHPSVEMDRKAEPAAAPQQQDANAQAAAQTTVMGAAPATTEDQRIAGEVLQALKSDPQLGAMKIDVHSEFSGMVTLRGRAPDPEARDRAGQIARNVGGVKTVDNMLTLG